MKYFPPAFVTVRVSVPCTLIVTPESGAPAVELTVPETDKSWLNALPLKASVKSTLIPAARSQRGRRLKNEFVPGTFSMSNPPITCMSTPPNNAPTFTSLDVKGV
jgi:hypothetical protein